MLESHLRAVLPKTLCIAAVLNLFTVSVFKVTVPTVDAHKCVWKLCVGWEEKEGMLSLVRVPRND